MPVYEVETADGVFEVESATDLTDEQILEHLRSDQDLTPPGDPARRAEMQAQMTVEQQRGERWGNIADRLGQLQQGTVGIDNPVRTMLGLGGAWQALGMENPYDTANRSLIQPTLEGARMTPEVLKKGGEAVFDILGNMPGAGTEGISFAPPAPLSLQEQLGQSQSTNPGKTAEVAAGLQRAGVGMGEFFTTPMAALAAISGQAGPVAASIIQAEFLRSMMSGVPQQGQAFVDAVQNKDLGGAVEHGAGIAGTGAFTKSLGGGLIGKPSPPSYVDQKGTTRLLTDQKREGALLKPSERGPDADAPYRQDRLPMVSEGAQGVRDTIQRVNTELLQARASFVELDKRLNTLNEEAGPTIVGEQRAKLEAEHEDIARLIQEKESFLGRLKEDYKTLYKETKGLRARELAGEEITRPAPVETPILTTGIEDAFLHDEGEARARALVQPTLPADITPAIGRERIGDVRGGEQGGRAIGLQVSAEGQNIPSAGQTAVFSKADYIGPALRGPGSPYVSGKRNRMTPEENVAFTEWVGKQGSKYELNRMTDELKTEPEGERRLEQLGIVKRRIKVLDKELKTRQGQVGTEMPDKPQVPSLEEPISRAQQIKLLREEGMLEEQANSFLDNKIPARGIADALLKKRGMTGFGTIDEKGNRYIVEPSGKRIEVGDDVEHHAALTEGIKQFVQRIEKIKNPNIEEPKPQSALATSVDPTLRYDGEFPAGDKVYDQFTYYGEGAHKGATFYMPPGASKEAIAKRLAEKKAEFEMGAKVPAVEEPAIRKLDPQTETPEFKKWFEDSKVVDSETGKPLVVYHGTNKDFTVFDPSKTENRLDMGRYGESVSYFTTQKSTANRYAERGIGGDLTGNTIYPVYLSLKNPLVIKKGQSFTGAVNEAIGVIPNKYVSVERVIELLKEAGYDGIFEPYARYWNGTRPTYAAFYPKQIKSAIGNKGTFDPASPNILEEPRFFTDKPSTKTKPSAPPEPEVSPTEKIGRFDDVPINDRPAGDRVTIVQKDAEGKTSGTYDAIDLGRDPSGTHWIGKPVVVSKGITRIEHRRLTPDEKITEPAKPIEPERFTQPAKPGNGPATVESVYHRIAEDKNDPYNEMASALLEQAKGDPEGLRVPVQVKPLIGAAGRYTGHDLVVMDPRFRDSSGTLLHEGIHALTVKKVAGELHDVTWSNNMSFERQKQMMDDYLSKGKNEDVKALIRTFYDTQAAWEALSKEKRFEWINKDSNLLMDYGFTNIYEMMAEVGSRPTFQQWLASVVNKNNVSLWKRWVNAFKRLSGLDKISGTLLERVMHDTAKIVSQPRSNFVPEVQSAASVASILPPKLKDWLKVKQRELLTSAETKSMVDGSGDMPTYRDRVAERKMATSPQGMGRIPLIGQMMDSRSKAKDLGTQATLTWAVTRVKGENWTALWRAARDKESPFLHDETGTYRRTDGSRGYMGDDIEAEMRVPGSQKFTPAQRAFVKEAKASIKRAVKWMKEEGVKTFIEYDDQGNIIREIPVDEAYFPHTVASKTGGNRGPSLPGARQPSHRERHYEREENGRKKEVEYVADGYDRLAKYWNDVYHAVADQRLLKDFEDAGLVVKEDRAARRGEGKVFLPVFNGRILKDVDAKRLNSYFHDAIPPSLRWAEQANNAIKGVEANLDGSTPYVQGLALMLTRPATWAKATGNHYKAFLKKDVMRKYLQEPEMMKLAQIFIENNGSLERAQDFMQGMGPKGLLRTVPGLKQTIGIVAGASERAMSTFFSIAKLELFKSLKDQFPKEQWPELVEAIENQVGMGKMESGGMSRTRAWAERMLLFAPSYYRAGASMLAGALRSGPTGKLAREGIPSFLAAQTLIALGTYYLFGYSDKEIKERLNPADPKFLMIEHRLSNGRVLDVGPQNLTIQGVRLIANSMSEKGRASLSEAGTRNLLFQFLGYKKAPLIGFISRLVDRGTNWKGEEQNIAEVIIDTLSPFVVSSYRQGGTFEEKLYSAAYSTFGLKVKAESPGAFMGRREEEEATKKYPGRAYDKLTLNERRQVDKPLKEELRTFKKERESTVDLNWIGKAKEARTEKLRSSLNKPVQQMLKDHDLDLPGYEEYLKKEGVTSRLSKDEQELLQSLMVQFYNQKLTPLVSRQWGQWGREYKQGKLAEELKEAHKKAVNALRRRLSE